MIIVCLFDSKFPAAQIVPFLSLHFPTSTSKIYLEKGYAKAAADSVNASRILSSNQ